MQKLSETLRERGYVYQHSSQTLEEVTDGDKRAVYLGIDPTADSLHIGHLQPMLVLRRFLEDGHKVILLIGGGTGMIGDPSGKSEERNLLDDKAVQKNAQAIEAQAKKLFGGLDFNLANNADWLGKLKLIEFLRDVGKHFSVNTMLQRDSVKGRLESAEEGISYTEFSYMLLQSYDFLHLHEEFKCDLQIGSSDQWGNIVSGVDFIRRKTGDAVYGLTSPLLVNKSTGKKFGKSESGTVWLDPEKTTPFQFYQFWFNTEDAMVEEYLLKMTMLPKAEIDSIIAEHARVPAERSGQKKLAWEVTALVHGKEAADSARDASEAVFDGTGNASANAPKTTVQVGESLADILVRAGLASSKREARQFIDDGAIVLNGEKISDTTRVVGKEDFNNSAQAILKRGKRNVSVLVL